MFSPYLRRIFIDVSLFAATAIVLLYCREEFVDFLISIFHFGDKINLSSLAFIIQRAMLILFPLMLLTPKTKIQKVTIVKVMLYTVAICYFLGNTWIISYLIENSFSQEAFSNLWYGSIPVWFGNELTQAASDALYDFQYSNAYVFNYIIWDSYNLLGVVFSTIMGIMYIRFANKLRGNMVKICNRYLMIMILSVAIPIIGNLFAGSEHIISDLWMKKNNMIILSWVFVYAAFRLSTISRIYWDDLFG